MAVVGVGGSGGTRRRERVAPMGAPREAWKRRADSVEVMMRGRCHRPLDEGACPSTAKVPGVIGDRTRDRRAVALRCEL